MVQQAFTQVHKPTQIQKTVAGGSVQRKCEKCRKKKVLQGYANEPAMDTLPLIGHDKLRLPGQPHDTARPAFMEPRFGQDFSQIPAHSRSPANLQAKLAVNTPGDVFEQEADRVSEQVTAMREHHFVGGASPRIQRFSGQSNGQMIDMVPASVDSALASPGRPLEPGLRQDMEERFGSDFSQVRVHSGPAAERSARDVNAHAYTAGHDIVFGAGRFAPGTHEGRRLIAHELTHVVQQGGLDSAAKLVSHISSTNQVVQRQPAPPAPRLTRPEEIRLSYSSPGKIRVEGSPPAISLYNFAIGQAALKEEHVAALQALASRTKPSAGDKLSITVKGHADSSGEDPINDPLSKDRALTVQKAIEHAAGVPVDIFWFGERRPVATNGTVEGRTRNRRVDIYLTSSKKGGTIDWPHLCALVPEICLCLANPAFCRKKDDKDDGDGIHWPSLCSGTLGKGICIGIICALSPKLCLSGLCRMFPELCLISLCAVFPSLCKHKRKPPEEKEEPKPKKACPTRVDLPSGDIPALIIEKPGFAKVYYPFHMDIDFDWKSSGCGCECGEYMQQVKGYQMFDLTGKGNWQKDPRIDEMTKGVFLSEDIFQEDGVVGLGAYGHRFWDDMTRTQPKPQLPVDMFLSKRENGCEYRGKDEPAIEVRKAGAKVKMDLEFMGGTC